MTSHDSLGAMATIESHPTQGGGAAASRMPEDGRRAYPRVLGHIVCAVGLIGLWRERAWGRRRLAMLPEHLLKDVGVTSLEARREIEKPFWRA